MAVSYAVATAAIHIQTQLADCRSWNPDKSNQIFLYFTVQFWITCVLKTRDAAKYFLGCVQTHLKAKQLSNLENED